MSKFWRDFWVYYMFAPLFVLVAGGLILYFGFGIGKEQGHRKFFSDTQSIKTLPSKLGGNNTLNLDNIATLNVWTIDGNKITLVLDTVPIKWVLPHFYGRLS